MLSLSKRYAVYIPTSPRPSSKIFDFFGISPSASPTSSLRRLLSRQGTGGRATSQDGGGQHADRPDIKDQVGEGKGWSHTEAYKEHEEPLRVRCTRCLGQFVWHFGVIWFLIPINAGLIGLLLRQILLHVLIPSDLVHVPNNVPISPSSTSDRASNNPSPAWGHSIQIKASILRTSQPFRGQVTLQTISTVFFFIGLVLFVLFSILFFLRLICFRQAAWRDVLGLDLNRETASPAGDADKDMEQHPSHSHRTTRTTRSTNPIGDLALWPLAWLTVVAFSVCIMPEMDGSKSMYRNLVYGAYISWWISTAWTLLTTVLILGILILANPDSSAARAETNQHWKWKLPSNLLFIPVALSTVAVVGALLVSDLLITSPSGTGTTGTHPRPTLPVSAVLAMLIVSFCAVGASLFLSAILFPAMLFTHLFSESVPSSRLLPQDRYTEAPERDRKHAHIDPRGFGLLRTGTPVVIAPPEPEPDHPEPYKRPRAVSGKDDPNMKQKRRGIFPTTMIFNLITAVSLSSAAIQLLGSSLSPIQSSPHAPGTAGSEAGAFLTNTSPSVLSIPCLLLSILLLGICALWFLLAMVIFSYFAIKRQLRWNMELGHGIVLSFTSMGLSSVVFAAELDSGFFRVVACVFLGLVVVGFVVNLAFTACWVISGAYKRC